MKKVLLQNFLTGWLTACASAISHARNSMADISSTTIAKPLDLSADPFTRSIALPLAPVFRNLPLQIRASLALAAPGHRLHSIPTPLVRSPPSNPTADNIYVPRPPGPSPS